MVDEVAIGDRFRALAPELDERRRRLWAAAEARSCGRGGIAAIARATGISEGTIRSGLRELAAGERFQPGRVRRPGGGRKRLADKDPTLLADLERLVDSGSRGDPESPLRWTAKSVRKLADALRELGHRVSFRTVARRNGGRELRPKGSPVPVRVHDFKDPELGKAIPYGIYDLADDSGWVNVASDHDTAQFAVASIRGWWQHLGAERYRDASTLTITADCGGSNGYRTRLWKTELQRLADDTGLEIRVCHFPPATSKWNRIEHRLFSFITQTWRGKPLESLQVIINLIAATSTHTGPTVYAQLDHRSYPKLTISDDQLATIQIDGDRFHPE